MESAGVEPKTVNTWVRLATGVLASVLAYLLIVFFWDGGAFTLPVRRRYLLFALVASIVALHALLHFGNARGRLSLARTKDIFVAGLAVLFTLSGLDAAYVVYRRLAGSTDGSFEAARLSDPNHWMGEVMPRRYNPTPHTFLVHKPNVVASYTMFGDLYYGGLQQSRTLVDHVLEPSRRTYVIDEFGFRNAASDTPGRVLALGDSYTFGVSVDQDSTWVSRLSVHLQEPVYNLGVSRHSPQEELLLLEYFLGTVPRAADPELVLWMIFEGNDLEDEYESIGPLTEPSDGESQAPGFIQRLRGRLVAFPSVLQAHSALYALTERVAEARIGLDGGSDDEVDPLVVDGMRIGNALYRSEVHGYKLFRPDYVRTARRPETYVLNHPNRRHLDATFADMRALAERYGFAVVVIVAPSAARLHGPQFEGFPPLSREPYFINYVRDLAQGTGFGYVDLYAAMQPHAATRLLYWRDDTHWNDDGHELAAMVISDWLIGQGQNVPGAAVRHPRTE